MIYTTKKDIWIVFIVALGGLFLFAQAVNLIIVKGFHYPGTWILCVTFIFYFGLLILLAYPINYEITASTLEIRSGILLRYKIPLPSIVRVGPTSSPLSAPAWSLDRLRIDYLTNGKKKVVLISPRDKKTFLRQLIETAPSLELKGNVVMRK